VGTRQGAAHDHLGFVHAVTFENADAVAGRHRRLENGGRPSDEELAGHPVLVHFWSVSCYICHNVADVVSGWRDKYEPRGLKVIAIHQPRGPEELDVAKVTADAHGEMGITQP